MRTNRSIVSALLAPLACAVFGAAAPAQTYNLTILGTFRTDGTGNSYAYGINDAGLVVGGAQTDTEDRHVFRWTSGGGMIDVGRLVPPYISFALCVNASGELSGAGYTQSNGFASAVRQAAGGELINLPEPGGDSYGYSIADDGTIVGWSNFNQGCGGPQCFSNPGHAARWNGTDFHLLPELGGYFSVATGITANGSILCGYAADSSGSTRGYRQVGIAGTPVPLSPLPGDTASYANGLNSAGDVVGWSVGTDNRAHAVIWPSGSTTASNLGILGGALDSYAIAINASGVIVGYCTFSGPTYRATLFNSGGAPVDLNTVVAPGGPAGWTLSYADEVNASGSIVGYADNGTSTQAMLLTPVPPCIGDINGDHTINTADLVVLLAHFGQPVPPGTLGDINGDGTVNTVDLTQLLGHFGHLCS